MKLFIRPLRLLMLGCILFAYSNDLAAEQTPFGDVNFPWEVTVAMPSGLGPHTAIVQAAFDEAVLLQSQLGPGGVVRFPSGNPTYRVGHLTSPDTYVGVAVADFDGYVLGNNSTIQAFDTQPLISGLAWGAYHMLRFNGGDIKLAQLNFIAPGEDDSALGLFENSSTIRGCHFEGMGRGIGIGSEFAGGTKLVLNGVGWHTEGDGGDRIGTHSIFDNSFDDVIHGVVVIRADGGVVNIFDNTCENCDNLAAGWGNSGTTFIASDNVITGLSRFALFFGNQGALGTTHRPTRAVDSSRVIFTDNYIANGCYIGVNVPDDALDPRVNSGSTKPVPERALKTTISRNELYGCGIFVTGFDGHVSDNTVIGPRFVGIDVGWEPFGHFRATQGYKLTGNTVQGFVYDIWLEPTTSESKVRGGTYNSLLDEGTDNTVRPHP